MTDMEGAPPPAPAYLGSGPSGPRASFGRRLVAVVLDDILLGIVYAIFFALLGRGGAYGVGLLVSLGYYTFFEGSSSGQTVGKRVFNIRVIDLYSSTLGCVTKFILRKTPSPHTV